MRALMLLPLLAVGCVSPARQGAAATASFWWVKQMSMDASDVQKIPLHRLGLDEKPFWTMDDLVYYDPVSGHLAVAPSAMGRVLVRQRQTGTMLHGMPFVVKIDQKRYLGGAFFSHLATDEPSLPAIYVDTQLRFAELPIGTKLETKLWRRVLLDYDGNYLLECTGVFQGPLLEVVEQAGKIRGPLLQYDGVEP